MKRLTFFNNSAIFWGWHQMYFFCITLRASCVARFVLLGGTFEIFPASISFFEGLESLDIIGQIRSSSCLWLLSNFYKVSYLGKWEICLIFQSKYLNIFLSWWYQMKSVFHSEKCPMFRRSEIITTFWILASIASYCQHQNYMAK